MKYEVSIIPVPEIGDVVEIHSHCLDGITSNSLCPSRTGRVVNFSQEQPLIVRPIVGCTNCHFSPDLAQIVYPPSNVVSRILTLQKELAGEIPGWLQRR